MTARTSEPTMPDMLSDPELIEELIRRAEEAEAAARRAHLDARKAEQHALQALAEAKAHADLAWTASDAARATVRALRQALGLPPKT